MAAEKTHGYDLKCPHSLKETQQWFASIIVRPIDMHNNMMPVSPRGTPMEEEATKYIRPSHSLTPHKRIELYNQQYWWRLLNTLHDIFALMVRLFGYVDFNQMIGFPYLVKYPPKDWSLNNLGIHMLTWLKESYHETDSKLIIDAASVDLAYNQSFIAKKLKPLNVNDFPNQELSALLKPRLYLQPFVYLFEFDYNLFAFRKEFLQHDPNYWAEHDFPKLELGKKFFVLCRTPSNEIVWSELKAGEYSLLKAFKEGSSIEDACQWLEGQEEAIYNEALEHLQLWFQRWASRQWLTLEKPI